MEPKVALFDSNTIGSLSWPRNEQGQLAKKYLVPIIKNGPEHYVDNIHGRMFALAVDDLVIPVFVDADQVSSSNVCSPYGHYVEYAKQELNELNNPVIKWGLSGFLSAMGLLLRLTDVDKVVSVNNWLLTTNPCPGLSSEQVAAVTAYLKEKYPDRAIVFRSVDAYTYPAYPETLRANGYRMVGARTIYFLDGSNSAYLKTQNIRRDLKLLANTSYEIVDASQLCESDIPRITGLYRDLYLRKYTFLNPQFNEDFFRHILRNKVFTFKGLRGNNRIDAFACWYIWGTMLMAGVVGYDMQLPRDMGLYRQAMALFIYEAREKGLRLNLSGGAGSFKLLRGCEANMEFNAVHDQHLPFVRRVPWSCLERLFNSSVFQRISAKV